MAFASSIPIIINCTSITNRQKLKYPSSLHITTIVVRRREGEHFTGRRKENMLQKNLFQKRYF